MTSADYHDRAAVVGEPLPCWAAYQTYTAPIPWGNLVHSLEHGAIVIVYNCPDGCDADVAEHPGVHRRAAADSDCAPTLGKNRIILMPDPDPNLGVRFAASAWDWTLRADCFDPVAFRQFFDDHYDHGREVICCRRLAAGRSLQRRLPRSSADEALSRRTGVREGVQLGGRRVDEAAADLRGQAGQRRPRFGDAIELVAGGGALGGRRGGALRERDQRLERDEAARAVGVGGDQRAAQRPGVHLLRPDRAPAPAAPRCARRRRDRARRARAPAPPAPGARAASRPNARAAAVAQRLAARAHRLAEQPEARLARIGQLADAGDGRLARGAIAAVEHRLERRQHVARAAARRARPAGASPRRAPLSERSSTAPRTISSAARRAAASRAGGAAPAARTASSRTVSSPSRAACLSSPHSSALAAAATIACRSATSPCTSAPSSARSASARRLAAGDRPPPSSGAGQRR